MSRRRTRLRRARREHAAGEGSDSPGLPTAAARRAWGWIRRIAPWALALLVLALVARQARTVDWAAVWQALRSLPLAHVAAAVALALASHGLYSSFDLVGRRLTGHPLSAARTLGTAAISYAFNLNFGAWVGGLALRLRLYGRWGLEVPTVLQIVAYSMVTNWLGYLWVGGALLLWSPPPLPSAWMLPDAGVRALGGLMVAAALAYLALCRFSPRRRLTWRTHTLVLPGGRLAALQALAGGVNWLLIGAIAWGLLGGRIDYVSVLAAMLLAAVAGVVTHVPANLGVLEAVVLATLGGRLAAHELLAAMLAFRAAYYLLPLALALPAYALSEAAARRTAAASPPRAQPPPGRHVRNGTDATLAQCQPVHPMALSSSTRPSQPHKEPMQVLLHSNPGADGSLHMADHLTTLVKDAMGRFGERVSGVDAHLSDSNGPAKARREEIHCTMSARLVGLDTVVTNQHAYSAHRAIDGALRKLKRAVGAEIARHDPRGHRARPLSPANGGSEDEYEAESDTHEGEHEVDRGGAFGRGGG